MIHRQSPLLEQQAPRGPERWRRPLDRSGADSPSGAGALGGWQWISGKPLDYSNWAAAHQTTASRSRITATSSKWRVPQPGPRETICPTVHPNSKRCEPSRTQNRYKSLDVIHQSRVATAMREHIFSQHSDSPQLPRRQAGAKSKKTASTWLAFWLHRHWQRSPLLLLLPSPCRLERPQTRKEQNKLRQNRPHVCLISAHLALLLLLSARFSF